MKKFLALFLSVIMLIGLCGCFDSNDADEDVRGDIISESSRQDENAHEDEPEFSLGQAANNTYNNDFLGVSCTLPTEWVFYTDDQILELNNIVGDVVDEDISERLENANIIYDMYASYQDEGSSININLEKLTAAQLIGLDIKETVEAQIDAIKQSYQSMGYTDINVAYEEKEVDGKEFDTLKLTAKIQGFDFYATVLTFRKSNYLANITLCSLQTDKIDTILSYFTIK